MEHHFIYKDSKSDKFWNIKVEGKSFTVIYGKSGTSGTSQTKTFGSVEKCLKEAEKLVSEKKKKGYVDGKAKTTSSQTKQPAAKATTKTGTAVKDATYSIKKNDRIIIKAVTQEKALQMLVDISNDIHGKIIEHSGYDSGDDIIQLFFEIGNKKLDEYKFFKDLPNQNEMILLTKQFIQRLIAHNKDHETIYTHEELETGTFAIEYLVKADPANLSLYIEFLDSIDLDHTVEQLALVDRIAEVYDEEVLQPLFTFLREHAGELFANWFRSKSTKSAAQSPLHEAVREKKIAVAKELIEQKSMNLDELDSMNGFAPLHYSTGSIEIAKLLLEAGADINSQNTKGETILHICLEDDDTAFTEFIMGSGADIKVKDKEGRSAIHHVQTVEGLTLVLKHGGKLNEQDDEGNTLLHILAPWNFEAELFEEILKCGADPNALNNRGNGPLYNAAINTQEETAKILLKAGADPNLKNKDGKSAADELLFL